MNEERIESAVKRIEIAMARITEVADSTKPAPPSISALTLEHESLRETVSNALNELDELIEGLEQ